MTPRSKMGMTEFPILQGRTLGALFASVAGNGLTDLRVQESEESEMVRQKRNELERPTLPKLVHSF